MSAGFENKIVNQEIYDRAVERFRQAGIKLPRIAQLADPVAFREEIEERLGSVDPDKPDARNLFRVHWHNDSDGRGLVDIPDQALTS